MSLAKAMFSEWENGTVAKEKSDLSSKIIASRWFLIKKFICINGQEESGILLPAGCTATESQDGSGWRGP